MIYFYTDGACKGNPGPGGFGVTCVINNIVFYEYSEQCQETTNNREEMKAILHVFKLAAKVAPDADIIIYSDSAYCVNMINDWIWKWANNGWKNSKKQTVENLDLVQELYKYINTEFFNCQVCKCDAHKGMVGNELADALATNNFKKFNKILKDNKIENVWSGQDNF